MSRSFIAAAIFLVCFSGIALSQKHKCPKSMAACQLEGCSPSDAYDHELDKKKNRSDALNGEIVDIKFQEMTSLVQPSVWATGRDRSTLATTLHGNALREGTAVRVEGYLWAAKREHKESCNCELDGKGLKGERLTDIHMVMTLTPKAKETRSFTAEITPRVRAQRPDPDAWLVSKIRKLKGRYIRVTGFLLLDTGHLNDAEPKRAKSWEVHPVTMLEVCTAKDPAVCKQGTSWQEVK
ncbi:MAG: hypothetical protein ACJ73D_06175 [Pyrinomonadaceae bacterium]